MTVIDETVLILNDLVGLMVVDGQALKGRV